MKKSFLKDGKEIRIFKKKTKTEGGKDFNFI